MRCVLSCLGSWDVCIESPGGDWGQSVHALISAGVRFALSMVLMPSLEEVKSASACLTLGPSSLTWTSQTMFKSCLSTLTFCFWQLHLQPRLVMEKSYTLQWQRREWEGIK